MPATATNSAPASQQEQAEPASQKAGLPETMASPTTLTIKGRTYVVSPINLQDIGTLMAKSLDAYKVSLLSGLVAAAEYVPGAEIADERKRILRLDHLDLPTKVIMLDEHGYPTDDDEKCETREIIDYWSWWADNTYEGKVNQVWLSLSKQQPDVTIDYVKQEIMGVTLEEAARAAATVSKRTVGNAEAVGQAA